MKTLETMVFLLVTLSSCGQTVSTDRKETSNELTSQDASNIYKKITSEVCNCTLTTMKNNRPSTTLDSCYKIGIEKFSDTLKILGFDPKSSVGKNKLLNEIKFYTCKDLYTLMQNEWTDNEAKKLLFKGGLVKQTKLPSGLYEIEMSDAKSKRIMTFYTKIQLDEKQIKKYKAGYELTLEYEIIKNFTTKKDEYFLKQFGEVSRVGAVEVTNQK